MSKTPTLSRRSFLTRSAAVAATAGAATIGGTQLAFASPDDPSTGDAVVLIFLRGGADGLSMLPPYGYSSYRQIRPGIAVGAPGSGGGALALNSSSSGNARFSSGLDGVVGLHPAMKPIHDTLWKEGTLALIPGVGMSDSRTRSHFTSQGYWERGSASTQVRTGFLDRLLTLQGVNGGLGGVSKSGGLDASLIGPSQSVSLDRLTDFRLREFGDDDAASAAIRALNQGGGLVERTAGGVFAMIDRFEPLRQAANNRDSYPNSELGRDLRDVAVLLGSGVGLRAVAISNGGWDHHSNLKDRFQRSADGLGTALRAFTDDLKASGAYAETTIVVLSEFGRTIRQNGSGGADHGRAGMMMLMGGNIQGGVFGYDYYDEIADGPSGRDLEVLTDWRDPVSEAITTRVGVDASRVFPTHTASATPLGVAKA